MRTGKVTSAGFTLIEILIVVMILGIASSMIVSAIGSRDDLKVSAAARVLLSDLMYAQTRAVTTQKVTYVQFDTTNGTYTLLSSLSPRTVLKHPVRGDDFVMRFGSSPSSGLSGVTLVSAGFDGRSIVAFNELGSPLSVDNAAASMSPMNSGSVSLTCGAESLQVRVEPFTGEITIHNANTGS